MCIYLGEAFSFSCCERLSCISDVQKVSDHYIIIIIMASVHILSVLVYFSALFMFGWYSELFFSPLLKQLDKA